MSGFGGSVKLTGESEYKKALSDINKSLRQTSADLKLVNAMYGANDKSLSATTAREKVLNKQYDEQDKKVKILTKQLKEMDTEYQKSAKQHEALTKSLDKETKKLEEIEKTSGKTSDEYKAQKQIVADLTKEVNTSAKSLEKQGDALSKLKVELTNAKSGLEQTKQAIKDVGDKAKESAKEGFTVMKAVIADLASTAIKNALAGMKELSGAVVDLGKQAVSVYADTQQLSGGIEKLFGTGGVYTIEQYAEQVGKSVEDVEDEYNNLITAQNNVFRNASEAYEKAGMSQNQYMETVTGFSASLITALEGDTLKASEIANTAVQDMADNANTFGSSVEDIAGVYQSLAKGTYTTLDNLKLGYGGTKEEALRLVKDAGVVSDKIKSIDEVSFDQLIEAIHITQENMKITGTTMNEASGTISGSLGMLKNSWTDLLGSIADENGDVDFFADHFVESIKAVVANIKPLISTVLFNVIEVGETLISDVLPDLIDDALEVIDEAFPLIEKALDLFIDKVLPSLLDMIPPLLEKLAPKLVSGTEKILQSINKILPKLLPIVSQLIQDTLKFLVSALPSLISAGKDILFSILGGIRDAIPELIAMLPEVINAIVSTLLDPESVNELLNMALDIMLEICNGLTEALPELIAMVPDIIIALCDTLTDPENMGRLLVTAGKIIYKLSEGIVMSVGSITVSAGRIMSELLSGLKTWLKRIGSVGADVIDYFVTGISSVMHDLKKKAEEIGSNIWEKIKSLPDDMIEFGKDIIRGIGKGISSMWDWLKNQVFGKGIKSFVEDAKKQLGIASPSRVFRDQVGKNIALGIGVGFSDEMEEVSREMQEAIPTSLDLPDIKAGDVRIGSSGSSSYRDLVNAFKEALSDVEVTMDNVNMGRFVRKTVTQAIYT